MAETEKQKDIYILGIESSCDETAASVVKNGREVLSNVISSQIALHTLYGGVVPEIASRKHIEKILDSFTIISVKNVESSLEDISGYSLPNRICHGTIATMKLWLLYHGKRQGTPVAWVQL